MSLGYQHCTSQGYLSVDWSLNPCGQWHQQGWSGKWPAQQSEGAWGASGNWDNHLKRTSSCVPSSERAELSTWLCGGLSSCSCYWWVHLILISLTVTFLHRNIGQKILLLMTIVQWHSVYHTHLQSLGSNWDYLDSNHHAVISKFGQFLSLHIAPVHSFKFLLSNVECWIHICTNCCHTLILVWLDDYSNKLHFQFNCIAVLMGAFKVALEKIV